MNPELVPDGTPDPASQPFIKLDQFLKLTGIAATGGQAKILIQGGYVQVNDEIETRRGRKLRTGDRVEFEDQGFEVQF
ncbi:RNA-binding S4 domain-containing protein [Prochlorothrix hollandica]|uniref:RNA-binding protein n=1 Tax=Prochlorothrix hollandica PCC 9006 = CALU 1027 TaxID=317619 RepID=A0A0M2PZ89_PROHO|nr:RNA-binding S4 domain-containing protein [Prochlorothrix hollandica]KKJ00009.1 RNA-binding protein [Prochlorothrix hollandica PCC 9006 = CALU 1027]